MKKSAKCGSWEIRIQDDSSVTVLKSGSVCDNAKGALREIAESIHFTPDSGWNTRQFGSKLVDAINSGAYSKPSTVSKPSTASSEEPVFQKVVDLGDESAAKTISKVRVYGKAQNRTALGIVNAYMVMHPEATMADLQKAFPNSLNPDSGVKENFVVEGDKGTTADWNGYFSKEDELIKTGDGTRVALVSMWTKPSFERLVAHAAQYGIEIAQFDAADGGGKKGSFRLEYLNGYVPPVVTKPAPKPVPPTPKPAPQPEPEPKKNKTKMWACIGIVAFLLLSFIICVNTCSDSNEQDEDQLLSELAQLEDEFNSVQFKKGKATLSLEARETLDKIVEVMQNNPEIKILVVGHTSAEGNDAVNQQLSEDRAQAVAQYIEEQGVDMLRIDFEGRGSSEPVDPNDPKVNRRVEFVLK